MTERQGAEVLLQVFLQVLATRQAMETRSVHYDPMCCNAMQYYTMQYDTM